MTKSKLHFYRYFFAYAAALAIINHSVFAQIHLLDDALSPRAKSLSGNSALSGAYDVSNPLACSQKAAIQNVGTHWIKNTAFVEITNSAQETKKVSAKVLSESIRDSIANAFQQLKAAGDTTAEKNHVCTGLYNYGEVNAKSYREGYIAFDPKVISYLYSLPDDKRSSMGLDAAVLHEFGHQMQYWHALTFDNDPTVRRKELAADCASGALLALRWHSLTKEIWDLSKKGIAGAAAAVGDFDFEYHEHHGTPSERKAAILAGVSLVDTHYNFWGTSLGLDSKTILDRCNSFVSDASSF